MSVAGLLPGVDEANPKRYAVGVDEWKERNQSLKDARPSTYEVSLGHVDGQEKRSRRLRFSCSGMQSFSRVCTSLSWEVAAGGLLGRLVYRYTTSRKLTALDPVPILIAFQMIVGGYITSENPDLFVSTEALTLDGVGVGASLIWQSRPRFRSQFLRFQCQLAENPGGGVVRYQRTVGEKKSQACGNTD